jgi:hypothetical protein
MSVSAVIKDKRRFRWCYRLKRWRMGPRYFLSDCRNCHELIVVTQGSSGHCGACHGKLTRARDLLRQFALFAVAREIRLGNLRRPSELVCADCERQAQQYEHRDYRKPLEVVPICRSCNMKRGPALPHTGLLIRRPRLEALEALEACA